MQFIFSDLKPEVSLVILFIQGGLTVRLACSNKIS